ncbi:MAG: hypothetical protein RLZ53_873 [Actinomycetota bacterium]|jgi:predicted lactoylglutathione lyase
MINAIFVNLPIENLKRSVEFFSGLGFKFNEQFTDEQSTCMLVGENIYVMLLEREKFAGFITKPIASKDVTEAILSLSCESTEAVKELVEKALSLGAKKVSEPADLGFMFNWGFEDLDGHLWEFFWMNPDYVQ